MIALDSFNGKNIFVLGLGVSGLAAVRALQAANANVFAWDDNQQVRDKLKIELCEPEKINFQTLESLILSPGIPLQFPSPHVLVEKARQANVEIIGDMELFARQHKANASKNIIIAITGTNGKSTTTALLSHVLQTAGWDIQMGGNIGKSVLSLANFSNEKNKAYVLECSSFQIELSPSLLPDIAILLNITPDHIDRHGSFENYAAIKHSLLNRAKYKIEGVNENPMQQNITAVKNACDYLQIESSIITKAIKTFENLPHRLQKIGCIGDIVVVNDSKATNESAAAAALGEFNNIYWIAGGQAKQGGIENIAKNSFSIVKAYLYGQDAKLFAGQLQGKIEFAIFENLSQATKSAAQEAKQKNKQATILFSPACASFDQFKNFAVRGNAFIEIVKNIEGYAP